MISKLDLDFESLEQLKYITAIESIYFQEPSSIAYIDKNRTLTEEDIERARNMPLGFTLTLEVFVERYNNNAIIKHFTYEQYIKHSEIQNLIKYFNLDVDKFWLLLLFIYDYCSTRFYQGRTLKLTAIEQLEQLINLIGVTNDEMTISFKAGQLKAKIDSPDAIKFMADAIIEYAKNIDSNTYKYLNKPSVEEHSICIKESPFCAFFGKMFLHFLSSQPQVRAKRRAGANHSLKEMELVSLLIYFTELSDNPNWYCPEEKYLKVILKQYNNYKYPNNVSCIYPEFIL